MAAVKFKDPCSILIAGSTGSGKTFLVSKIISQDVFENKPKDIYYCYNTYQKAFDDMALKNSNINFHHGLPGPEDIEKMCSSSDHACIILDDLAKEVMKSPDVQNLVTVKSHHCNVSVIIITQNAFEQGRCSRSIALNCHYMILLKNMRDIYQISLLGRQLYGPRKGRGLEEVYADCMKEPYGYLIIDLCPTSKDQLRLRTKIFPEEETIVYQLK